jgi:hypothetical protein
MGASHRVSSWPTMNCSLTAHELHSPTADWRLTWFQSNPVNCCWSSPAQSFLVSGRWDLRPYFCSLQTFTCFKIGPLLRREEESVCYWSLPLYWGVTHHWITEQSTLVNCCWPSAAWWFLVPSTTRLMTMFHQSSLHSLGAKIIENTACNSSAVAVW